MGGGSRLGGAAVPGSGESGVGSWERSAQAAARVGGVERAICANRAGEARGCLWGQGGAGGTAVAHARARAYVH